MEIEQFKYCADGAYPILQNVQHNSQYARVLQNNYAGKGGEVTATMQYCYQDFVAHRFNQDIATVLSGIAKVEMHHMELLADAILQLGGNPTISGSGGWWSGNSVYYNVNVINMINRDLRDEELAILDYKKAIAFIHNDEIDALLERIILDEEVHIEVLTRLKQAVEFYLSSPV